MATVAAIKEGLSEVSLVGGASLAYTKCSITGKGLQTLDGLQSFPLLRSLDASSNALTATGLGDALGACGSLTELNLSSNALADPVSLPSLAALQALDLSRNQLESPADFSGLPALTSLDLSGNQVGSVSSLGKMPALRSLKLAENKLASAVGLEASAPALTTLDLSSNALATFDGLALPQLTSLSVAKNGAKALDGLGGLPALASLDLSGNLLSTLEALAPLTELPSLKVLSLLGNPMVDAVEGLEDAPPPIDNYRIEVLVLLPRLGVLDDAEVTVEDREAAAALKAEREEAARLAAEEAAAAAASEE